MATRPCSSHQHPAAAASATWLVVAYAAAAVAALLPLVAVPRREVVGAASDCVQHLLLTGLLRVLLLRQPALSPCNRRQRQPAWLLLLQAVAMRCCHCCRGCVWLQRVTVPVPAGLPLLLQATCCFTQSCCSCCCAVAAVAAAAAALNACACCAAEVQLVPVPQRCGAARLAVGHADGQAVHKGAIEAAGITLLGSSSSSTAPTAAWRVSNCAAAATASQQHLAAVERAEKPTAEP